MQEAQPKYYPTTIEAIHLLVLYLVMETVIDFPLAMYDYQHDTNLLSNSWINFISSVSITAIIFIIGYKKARNKFSEVFALKSFNPLLIIPVIILLPALQYLVGFLNVAVEKAIPSPPWFWELFDRIFNNRFGFWGALFKVAIFAPIIEETLFRGIIMHGLMRNYKSSYAIFMSGLLFALYHLNPWQMSYTFFLGILLGWLMVRTRSLPLCIIVHAINNSLVLLSITYGQEISERFISRISTTNLVALSVVAMLFGVFLIMLLSKGFGHKKRKVRPVP